MAQFDKSKQSYLKTGLKFDDIKAKWLTCRQNQTSWGEKLFHMMKWLRCNLCKQEVVFLHCRKCSRQSSPSAVFFTAPRFLPCCSIICRWFSSFSVFRHLVVNIICIVYTSYLDLLCRFYHQGRCIRGNSATRSNMLFIKKKFTLVVTVRGSPSPHHLSCLFSVTKTKNFWPLKLINVHILVFQPS